MERKEKGMNNRYETVNKILVSLFHDVIDFEEKHIITDEFKDISTNDMHIIEAIGLEEPQNMSTIAAKIRVTVGTLTIAINNLVKKGYVARNRGEKDRRVVFISLTEKGKKAFVHHQKFHDEMTKAILKRLEDHEIEALLKALNNVMEYFEME